MIERIEALVEEVTPGEWEIGEAHEGGRAVWSQGEAGRFHVVSAHDDYRGEYDAAFIAHARQLLPLMLEIVRFAPEIAEELDAHGLSKHMKGAGEDECAVGYLLMNLRRDYASLDAYCADHLPEKEEK